MNRIITLSLFLILSTNIFSQDVRGITFRNDLTSAFELAEKEDKDVFFYFNVPDCESCDYVSKYFRNKSIAKLYNDFYLSYEIGADSIGREMARIYRIVDFPTLLYLNSEGMIRFSARGNREGRSIFDIGKFARLPERKLKRLMKEKFESDPNDTDHLYDYIEFQYTRGKFSKVENLLKAYLDQRDSIDRYAWMNLVIDYASNAESYANEILIKEKDDFIAEYGENYINEIIWNSLINNVEDKYDTYNVGRFEKKFIQEVVKNGLDPNDEELTLFYTKFLYSLNIERGSRMPKSTMDIFTKYTLAAIDIEKHTFDQEHLIELSIHILAFYQEKEALNKLYDVLEFHFEREAHFRYLDLQAVILYILKKEDQAIKKIVAARELALSQGDTDFKPSITMFKEMGIVK